MFLKNSIRDRKPQPGPLADVLGREERFEKMREMVGGDSGSLIANRDAPIISRFGSFSGRTSGFAAHRHFDFAALRHRLDCVHQQIREARRICSTSIGAIAEVASAAKQSRTWRLSANVRRSEIVCSMSWPKSVDARRGVLTRAKSSNWRMIFVILSISVLIAVGLTSTSSAATSFPAGPQRFRFSKPGR